MRIFRRIAIVHAGTPEAQHFAHHLLHEWEALESDGESYTAVVFPSILALEDRGPHTLGAIFVVGGDGTLLETVRWMTERALRIPLCGWNSGHVGFHMNDIPADGALRVALERISNLGCDFEHYDLLGIRMTGVGGAVRGVVYAFNEIAFIPVQPGQIAKLEFSIDGQSFGAHSGDGLIISTAQGTTGWGVGAHGPAVDPRVPAMVLIPKDPHPAMRHQQLLFPIVLPPEARITVRVVEPEKRAIAAIADGHGSTVIREATITMGGEESREVSMLSLPDAEGRGRFVRRLHQKFLKSE